MTKQEAYREAQHLNQFPDKYVYAYQPYPDRPDYWQVRITYLYDSRTYED